MNYYAVVYSNDLSHYGVKGQKWGVRRYQNPDGTLTAAGKKRLNREEKRIEKAAKKAAKKEMRADNWKLTEDTVHVMNTDSNRIAAKRLLTAPDVVNNPAKKQMATTISLIAQREFDLAKSKYVDTAKNYIEKYGREQYMKDVINTKYATNGKGRVHNLLSEDMAYSEFLNSLRDEH